MSLYEEYQTEKVKTSESLKSILEEKEVIRKEKEALDLRKREIKNSIEIIQEKEREIEKRELELEEAVSYTHLPEWIASFVTSLR